jgi:hypothetical protein
VNRHDAAFAFDVFSTAMSLVQAYTPDLHGRGHRRGLPDNTCEAFGSGAQSTLTRHQGVFEDCDLSVRVQGIRDGAKRGGDGVGFIKTGHVTGEPGGPADEEDEEP